MEHFLQILWQRCKGTFLGRLVAALLVGAMLGLPAALSVSQDAGTAALGTVGGALIGGTAVALLEWRDRRRSKFAESSRRDS
jgi:hypothetical protein